MLKRTLAPSARGHDPDFRPPRVQNNGELLRDGRLSPSLTWIGHATTLLQIGGWNVLTDPIYTDRLFLIPRRAPPGVALADLPPIDVVLISHDHIDHLDEDTVRALRDRRFGSGTLFVAPLGVGAWLRAHGITRVVELDWWQSVSTGDRYPDPSSNRAPDSSPDLIPPRVSRQPLAITLVPARHWGDRKSVV